MYVPSIYYILIHLIAKIHNLLEIMHLLLKIYDYKLIDLLKLFSANSFYFKIQIFSFHFIESKYLISIFLPKIYFVAKLKTYFLHILLYLTIGNCKFNIVLFAVFSCRILYVDFYVIYKHNFKKKGITK